MANSHVLDTFRRFKGTAGLKKDSKTLLAFGFLCHPLGFDCVVRHAFEPRWISRLLWPLVPTCIICLHSGHSSLLSTLIIVLLCITDFIGLELTFRVLDVEILLSFGFLLWHFQWRVAFRWARYNIRTRFNQYMSYYQLPTSTATTLRFSTFSGFAALIGVLNYHF